MKKIRNIGYLIAFLLIWLTTSWGSNISGNQTDQQAKSFHSEAVIYAPDAGISFFVLPENISAQVSASKEPVSTNRLFKASLSYLLNTFGSLLSAPEYFNICDHFFIRLSVSAIIFPFHYHW